MHHFQGKPAIEMSDSEFVIALQSQSSGAIVGITGPLLGVYEDKMKALTKDDVERLATRMATVLSEFEEGEETAQGYASAGE